VGSRLVYDHCVLPMMAEELPYSCISRRSHAEAQ
jgi:hypothetical protein